MSISPCELMEPAYPGVAEEGTVALLEGGDVVDYFFLVELVELV